MCVPCAPFFSDVHFLFIACVWERQGQVVCCAACGRRASKKLVMCRACMCMRCHNVSQPKIAIPTVWLDLRWPYFKTVVFKRGGGACPATTGVEDESKSLVHGWGPVWNCATPPIPWCSLWYERALSFRLPFVLLAERGVTIFRLSRCERSLF